MEALVSYNPGSHTIFIAIPIRYFGGGYTPELAAIINKQIEQTWSGQFGDYKVKTSVYEPEYTFDNNIIELREGDTVTDPYGNEMLGYCDYDREKLCGSIGSNSGVWAAGVSISIAAHEAGHLMALMDRYTKSTGISDPGYIKNIMGNFMAEPDSRNVEEILQAYEIDYPCYTPDTYTSEGGFQYEDATAF